MSTEVKKKIAVITGASSGLGLEFAKQIEEKYFLNEIWMVARRPEPMRDLAERFLKSKPVILPLDLNDEGDLASLKKKLEDESPEVEILVNNAGIGKIGPFHSLGLKEQLDTIDLNIRALTYLTHVCIPLMPNGAKILQVASSIGFSPAPYFAVYAATKAFVVSLSDALSYELKDKGISVTAVCPGPVATNFFSVAQKNEFMTGKVPDASPFNKGLMANADDVVRRALSDADKGKRHSIFGLPIKVFVRMLPFTPRSLVMHALALRKS